MVNFYSLKAALPKGQTYDFSQLEGKVVLIVNTASNQDPEDDEGINNFCQLNYGVSFPIMAKSDVNGAKANEVFKFLKHEKPGMLGLEGIKWNFTKFLVDKHGKVVERYSPTTKPDSIAKDVEKLLKQ
ncbi:glutathione peroxidase [Malassezia psittaci]|uniref:Glutathione peroxidase n=1 Tax=Malassezia psittaci TaxID=1821823 RepID=A0AAF0FCM1_9BASI|nr:glutathione peroxidase [Malassezia psittaci]